MGVSSVNSKENSSSNRAGRRRFFSCHSGNGGVVGRCIIVDVSILDIIDVVVERYGYRYGAGLYGLNEYDGDDGLIGDGDGEYDGDISGDGLIGETCE